MTTAAPPTEEEALPAERDERPRRRLGVRGGWWFRLALVVLLLSPWVIGKGMQAAGENRKVTPFPAVDQSSWRDTDTYRQVDQALKDRLPMKTAVVRIVGEASVRAGTSVTDRVVTGTDGTPFSSEDFLMPCDHRVRADRIGPLLDRWDAAAQRRGGEALFVISPDKSSVERQKLGDRADGLLACSDAARRAIDAAWPDATSDPVMTMWDAMAEQAASETDLYQRGDTHWTERGAAVMVGAVLERFAPDSSGIDFAADRFEEPWKSRPGDLYAQMGAIQDDQVPQVRAKRAGVTVERTSVPGTTFRGVRTVSATGSGSSDVIEGRTLIVHDSFYDRVDPMMQMYFGDSVLMHWSDLEARAKKGESLGQFDRVLFQSVQRMTAQRFQILQRPHIKTALDQALGTD